MLEDQNRSSDVDILLLGSGWTGTFLIPLMQKTVNLTYAVTTRTGNDGTIAFEFDQNSDDPHPFDRLPDAKTIVIIFPLTVDGSAKRLLTLYNKTHPAAKHVRWLQLGSTGAYKSARLVHEKEKAAAFRLINRHDKVDLSQARVKLESELLQACQESKCNKAAIMHLCGLWGGSRSIRRYVGRTAASKEELRSAGSIHMIHGVDVARAIVAMHQADDSVFNQRWLITDLHVYDKWDLAVRWGDGGEEGRGKLPSGQQAIWVAEFMQETGVQQLPRTPEQLGFAQTSLEFWTTLGIGPLLGGILD